jgi:hypothetical protein
VLLRAMFNSVLAQHAQRQMAQREENGARLAPRLQLFAKALE